MSLQSYEKGYKLPPRRPLFGPDPTYAARAATRAGHTKLWTPPGTASPPPPANFLTDNFTGTDGADLNTHTADSGATWARQGGAGGAILIQSNRVFGSTFESNYYASATPATADYVVDAVIFIVSHVAGGTAWVWGRMDTVQKTGYSALIYSPSSTTYQMIIRRWVNGTFGDPGTNTTLPTQPGSGTAHNLKLQMSGTQVTALWDNAVIIGPVTDVNITAAGKAGIGTPAYSTTTGMHFDSITAT